MRFESRGKEGEIPSGKPAAIGAQPPQRESAPCCAAQVGEWGSRVEEKWGRKVGGIGEEWRRRGIGCVVSPIEEKRCMEEVGRRRGKDGGGAERSRGENGGTPGEGDGCGCRSGTQQRGCSSESVCAVEWGGGHKHRKESKENDKRGLNTGKSRRP
eukprot:1186920-Rhodomonas_salina.4